MIIGGIDIYVDKNEALVIHKTKSQKFWQLFWYFLIAALIVGTCVYFIKHKERPAQLDFFSVLIMLIVVVAIAAITYLDIRRTIKHNTDYILKRQNDIITINNEPFSTTEEMGDVIIQTISDGNGARSFTIGLSSGKKFYPVTYNQGLEEAKEIASIIAHYLNTNVIIKESKLFSLFRGH
jgi:hypothetical protein